MSAYLSRLIINQRSRAARRDLANCQALHCTVMSAFPAAAKGVPAREQFGVLYRVETSPRTGIVQILVQSNIEPDWSRLPDSYLEDTAGELDNPACRTVDDAWAAIDAGMQLTFRLRANPTKRVNATKHADDKLAGKRVELQTEEEWLTWLVRRSESAGFDLLKVDANAEFGTGQQRRQRIDDIFGFHPEGEPDLSVPDARSNPVPKVHGTRDARKLTFGAVLFEGRLRVTDADRFREALATGIGPAKAYGFGLLSLAPAR